MIVQLSTGISKVLIFFHKKGINGLLKDDNEKKPLIIMNNGM
jgi:hypothetical protein